MTKVIKLRSKGIEWRNKKFRRLVVFLKMQITSRIITNLNKNLVSNSFEPVEQVSLNHISRFPLTKVIKLRSKVLNREIKNFAG